MGDRFSIDIKCANCEVINNDVYYAESSGYMSFICKECKKINWITQRFVAEIVSLEEEKRRYKDEGFGE